MKISQIDIHRVRLPMTKELSTGFGRISTKDEVIVKLTTSDGLVGYGEAATLSEPVYTHETVETCMLVISRHIASRILGKDFDNAEDFRKAYNDIIGNHLAKAGIESAFWHLLAQKGNVSLKQLFGGSQDTIRVGEGIGIQESIEDVLKEVDHYLQQGFVRIKVKIKPGWDKEPLAAIRKKWPKIELTADANAAYNLAEHKDLLCSLDEFNLAMLEQPLAFDDFVDHASLQRMIKTPICLDESIESLNDAHTAVALGSCKIINIKPGRVGGIVESLAIHDYAVNNGIGLWCGGMLETGIGRAFNIALASKAGFTHAADMSPTNTFYADDLIDPAITLSKNGTIEVSDKSGLGYNIDVFKLQKYSVDTITLN